MNSAITQRFFALIDETTKNEIVSSIAENYGISRDEAMDELLDPEAENLLEYLTGSIRLITSALMQCHDLR